MIDADSALRESDRITRSADETANFLAENFGPEECDRLALIAGMINIAVYERRPIDALFWSTVFARRERRALSKATRRELQALLEDSTNWDT